MKITGKLHKIFDTQVITDKFSKREFILEIFNNTFANYAKFEFQHDNCTKLNLFSEGQEVEIEFDIRGRAWTKDGNTTYFNTLVAWKIISLDNGESQAGQGVHIVEDLPEPDEELPF